MGEGLKRARQAARKTQLPLKQQPLKKPAPYVDLGRCDQCRTPRLAYCPNCVDSLHVQTGRSSERAEIVALIKKEIEFTPPFDGVRPALHRLLKKLEQRGDEAS